MKLLLLTLLIVTGLISCDAPKPANPGSDKDSLAATDSAGKTSMDSTRQIYSFEGDSVVVAPFQITIEFSEKAKKKIVDGKETIIVAVFLDGTPKDSATAHFEDDGSFYVGDIQKEISYDQVLRITDLKFSKKIYDQLGDKDANLTVNIYTGRKSSRNNLITGDLLAGKVSEIANKNFTLKYKLIGETN